MWAAFWNSFIQSLFYDSLNCFHHYVIHRYLTFMFDILQGIVVDKEFESVLEKIREKRLFTVRYDTSLPVNKGAAVKVDPKNVFNIDPIRILYFMKEHLRTIDLFLKFDKDSNNCLTRDEMQLAFEVQ